LERFETKDCHSVMELSLTIKDAIAAGGLMLTALSIVWHIRGQASKVSISINQIRSNLESTIRRLDKEERKSSRAHQRVDEIADKVTRIEVIVDQMTGGRT